MRGEQATVSICLALVGRGDSRFGRTINRSRLNHAAAAPTLAFLDRWIQQTDTKAPARAAWPPTPAQR